MKNYTKNFLLVFLLLIIFGLIFIYNATVISSQQIYGTPFKFVFLQLAWTLLGLAIMFIFYKLDYTKLASFSIVLYFISLVFLGTLGFVSLINSVRGVCDNFIPFVPCVNGAYRWVFINPEPLPKIPFIGVLGFQPVELAKLALILCLSFRLTPVIEGNKKGKNPFSVYMVLTLLISFLLYLQPNMSSAILCFAIGTSIYYISGASLKNFVFLVPIGLVAIVLLVLLSPYRRERLLTYIGREESQIVEDKDYHIKQVEIALGSGGFFGVGFGQSRQKYQYVPEVASDSIFAIIGEELGLIGTTAVLGLFFALIYYGLQIHKSAVTLEGKLISIGIISWISFQLFINVAAMLQIIPLTGVPIPFISYGGSSTVFMMAGVGLLCSVGRKAKV